MNAPLDRRSFLGFSAATGALVAAGCQSTRERTAVAGKLRHGCIGVGGMGGADMDQLSSHPDLDVVALCDVDRNFLKAASEKAPAARLYTDWRTMLEKERDHLDSVNVTTPDHMHAPIAMEAIRRGLHVYCQKPLTRTVMEARALAAAARGAGVVTQMGIQNHSQTHLRSARALFEGGHIGPVHSVHVWSDRPKGWWPQGVGRPEGSDPIPEGLDWDLWCGVSPQRPFKEGNYHPFSWRGWKDFGTGAQGDMGCHLMDPATWFLGLGHPTRIRSAGPRPNDETYPLWSRVHYEFPANEHTTRGPLLLTWYDGGKQVWRELLDELEAGEVLANACLFMGTEGALLASSEGPPRLLPESKFADVPIEEVAGVNHWHQFVEACLGREEATAGFDYAAHLTEVALLGNIALHFPHESLTWDGKKARFPDRPEADGYLEVAYREGWEVRGLS